jgi:hypothetical protein
MASVGPLQHRISYGDLVGLQDSECALTEQLGSAHAATSGDAVQPLNKFIVELNEDLFSSHAHMLTHMLPMGRTDAHERRRRTLTELYSNPVVSFVLSYCCNRTMLHPNLNWWPSDFEGQLPKALDPSLLPGVTPLEEAVPDGG